MKEKPNLNTKMKNQFKEYEINRYKHGQHTILSFFLSRIYIYQLSMHITDIQKFKKNVYFLQLLMFKNKSLCTVTTQKALTNNSAMLQKAISISIRFLKFWDILVCQIA